MFVRYLVAIITLPIYLTIFFFVAVIGGFIACVDLTIECFVEIIHPTDEGDDYASDSEI